MAMQDDQSVGMGIGVGQQAQPPTQSGAPQGDRPMPGQEQATPEEQQLYSEFVKNCGRIMYEKEFFHRLVDLAVAPDPVPGVGDAISAMVKQVLDDAEHRGIQITMDMFISAIGELVGKFASDLAEQGVVDLPQEQMDGIVYRAVTTLQEKLDAEGKLDHGKHQQMLEEYKRMDATGELQKMFAANAPQPNRETRRRRASMNRRNARRR